MGAKFNIKNETLQLTIPSNAWTGENAPYIALIEVEGITEDMNFFAPQVIPTGNQIQDKLLAHNLSCISGGATSTNLLTFYCYDKKPEVDLPIVMTMLFLED